MSVNERCQLDHIVMAAQSLTEGVAFFKEITGIDIPVGGFHPLMGTHNHLMQIGNNAFFEIIAIDPSATSPSRPRWYGLDDPNTARSLQTPRLLTWVVSTPSLDALLGQSDFHYGTALELTRGQLNWRLTVPEDGGLPNYGLLPSIIQWNHPGNPCGFMADMQCELQSINIYHPYRNWYEMQLKQINSDHLVQIHPTDGAGYMTVSISTPNGIIILDTRG